MLKIKLLNESITSKEQIISPAYHGGKWPGPPARINITGRGGLGAGAYFTQIKERAEYYAEETNGVVTQCSLRLKNPIILRSKKNEFNYTAPDGNHNVDPCCAILIFLGLKKEKAESVVEWAYDQFGYVGKQISTLAQKLGYDGIILYDDDLISEIVIWNNDAIINS